MDLENFPTSKSAIKMLQSVTNGFYERSYVGKWMYQVMGMEMDDAVEKYEELQSQIFPENATWGIIYHEQKYGIPTNPALSLDERRAEVIRRRDIHSPMNPARIEEIVKGLTNVEVEVTENVAPYTFAIDIATDGNTEQLNYSNIVRTVQRVKPSHLSFYAFFSASSAVNVVIETSAIAKWPLLAGEEFCGMCPVPAFEAEVSGLSIYGNADSRPNKMVSEFSGTMPDINAAAVLYSAEISTDIQGNPLKKVSLMPGELAAGVKPDENVEYRTNDIRLNGEMEVNSTIFSTPVSGTESIGTHPENEMVFGKEEIVLEGQAAGAGTIIRHRFSGEDSEKAAIYENGIGPEVSGEGIRIVHLMCGEDL